MIKPVKYTLLGLAGLLVLAAAAVAVFALTFDPNRYKDDIERIAKEKTGRTLKLEGDLQVAFWPSVGAGVSGVSLSEKGSDQNFVALDSAHASVKLLPLLRGEVIVDGVRLAGVKARIVKNQDGSYNFSDLLAGDKPQPSAPQKNPDEAKKPVVFDIASIAIERSSVAYIDLAAGQEYALEAFSLKTGRIAQDAEGKLEFSTVARRKAPALEVKLAVDGRYRLAGGKLSLDATAKLDQSTLKGKFSFAEPYEFDVSIDKLNLDRYIGEEKPQPAPEQKSVAKAKADTPVDFSPLEGLNARGKVQIGALQVRGLKLAEVNAALHADKGQVSVSPHSAKLYEGATTGELAIDAHRNHIALKEKLSNVAIGPLLRDLVEQDKLEGRGDVTLDVSAAGASVNQMKKALAGSARVELRDGALKGINIGEAIRKARSTLGQSASAGQSGQGDPRTDFTELTASFSIKNGVARNEDLDAKAPALRLGGAGSIDIAAETLDYTAKASVVATSKGQGGAERDRLAGLTLPVRLTGSFDDLKYEVDYRSIAAEAAKSEAGQRLSERLKDEKVREKLRGLLGR